MFHQIHAPSAVIVTTKAINMALILLSKPSSGQSPLDAANTANKNTFILYVLFLIAAFIGTVYFTWKLFDSGNRVQQAIQGDATARIEEAKRDATVKVDAARNDATIQIESAKSEAATESKRIESEAKVKIAEAIAEAGRANERASGLEKEAAEVKKQNLETATRLAEAQKAAADAQLVLKQRIEQAAIPRRIVMMERNGDREIRNQLSAGLDKYAGTTALIQAVSDHEAQQLAADIAVKLLQCGWRAEMLDPSKSNIPPLLIQPGVEIVTLEKSPFNMEKPPGAFDPSVISRISPAGQAGQALGRLPSLDLGPPYGPTFFGVHWRPAYSGINQEDVLLRRGFNFPSGAVLVLVGTKPVDEWWPETFSPRHK